MNVSPLANNGTTEAVPTGVEPGLASTPARVTLVASHDRGMAIGVLELDSRLVVGRSPAHGLCIDHPTLSRLHASFTLVRDRVFVEDAGSRNGVRWNGKRVTKAELQIGESVLLGAVWVRVQILGSRSESLELLSEERFRVDVEQERARAGQFGRQFSLLLVRAVPRPGLARAAAEHAWFEGVRSRLRAVDRISLYGSDAAQILLPETGPDESERVARSIAGPLAGSGISLLVGVASYPGAGDSADELVERSREAAYSAGPDEPVRIASGSVWPLGDNARGEGSLVAGAAMRKLLDMAELVASSRLPVVLHGETGTGKEVLARFLHEHGPRRGRRMVRVNCGAIPKDLLESTLFGHERGAFTGALQQQKGIFEEADGGTVFLDEIGELSLAAQAALLRVLESGSFSRVGSSREYEVDVRVVAATHRDLEGMTISGAFRADLYYRLGGVTLEIPPLRARRDEVELLAKRFLRIANDANGRSLSGFAPEVLAMFVSYPWPGNVRELRNAVERAVVVARGAWIGPADLPERLRGQPADSGQHDAARLDPSNDARSTPGPVRARMQGYESNLMRQALEASHWNRNQAAKELGIPVRTLSYRMKVLGLKRPGEAADGPPAAAASDCQRGELKGLVE